MIAVYHEHPDWFRPLFAELDRRGLDHVRIDASAHLYEPAERAVPYSLVVNRASPSAYLRGNRQSTFHTLHWLRHLERLGVPVVNGAAAYEMETSKALQLEVLAELGVAFPATRVINDPSRAVEAARGLRYPVLVKANIGGSGAGIERFDSEEQLHAAVQAGTLDLGVDGVALVQEQAPLRGGHITRVEFLGGRFLYAINVYPAANSFNLCPADVCQTTGGTELIRSACAIDAPDLGLTVEAFTPPPAIIEQLERVVGRVQLDVGGIEYLVDDRDGQPYVYDINALSNFVADAVNVIGFDPHARLVDYLETRLGDVAEGDSERGRRTDGHTGLAAEAVLTTASAAGGR